MIQRYENRPAELGVECLTDFVVWYTSVAVSNRSKSDNNEEEEDNDDVGDGDAQCHDGNYEKAVHGVNKRLSPRVTQYLCYELDTWLTTNEMVTLYLLSRTKQ